MKIRTLGSSIDGSPFTFAASYVIDDCLSIDAGSIGLSALSIQRQVQDVIVSHPHLDHIASLPLFIDNVYQPGPECVRVHGSAQVIDVLKQHFFNDVVWPDVVRLSQAESPFVEFCTLEPEKPVKIGRLTITPIALTHVVPTFGFVIEDGRSTVAFVSDTGPTERIWELLNERPKLEAVFLECAFPNSMQWLADKACHLTPQQFFGELDKLKHDPRRIVIHVKPAFQDAVVSELANDPDLVFPTANSEFEI